MNINAICVFLKLYTVLMCVNFPLYWCNFHVSMIRVDKVMNLQLTILQVRLVIGSLKETDHKNRRLGNVRAPT